MQTRSHDNPAWEQAPRERLNALESARAISEGIRKRRHGKPITKSVKVLEKVREERTVESFIHILLQWWKIRSGILDSRRTAGKSVPKRFEIELGAFDP